MSIYIILSDIHLVHYSLRLSAMRSVKKSEVNIFKFVRIRNLLQTAISFAKKKTHTYKNQHYVKNSFLEMFE